jgi:riboflavin kinase/FMN adenylyltransferase
MVVIEDAWRRSELRRPSIVTIGNFDGIHIGQQAILERVVARARETGLESVMVTFEPHPKTILRPEKTIRRLTTRAQKQALVARFGVGTMAEVEFDDSFADTGAQHFVETLLHEKLQAREVYVGSTFVFGRRKEGNLKLLRQLGSKLGFEAFGVEEVVLGEAPVSSTRIRRSIRQGDLAEANVMLNRPYSIYGVVEHGDGRGKLLGWPTMNVGTSHEVLPKDGVYASKVWLRGSGRQFDAVTNIGSRPTFPDGDPKVVESHVFDFDEEIYGEEVELCFLDRLRGEQAFPSAEALISQIEKDVGRAREYLQQEPCLEFMPTLGV